MVAFQATAGGNYTFDTIGSDYDTIIAVFTDCAGATELGCDDDIDPSVQSELTVTLTAGQTVLVSVGGLDGATGNWILNVTAP